ncbi:hypothetical protein Mp_6g10420 [Marchantia polymorpha subsp. ruderalis]|uniref:Uncharacterized protein n=2 Tax=Marchantia polymorpha TaxID=3197 RepID=A0AAF6BQK4_MARPO|nr:hypothetical protein MARPO_0016s0084 [Marchantia polymorpha]BBN14288.1 hypothetical protein Mp_6g10420 [Marchantia polymorpha subsp. ruderalis]|eukprot:PTQ45023.1 hypothetical protein MARPO_0016s0084 [Marchantia polymorpha]
MFFYERRRFSHARERMRQRGEEEQKRPREVRRETGSGEKIMREGTRPGRKHGPGRKAGMTDTGGAQFRTSGSGSKTEGGRPEADDINYSFSICPRAALPGGSMFTLGDVQVAVRHCCPLHVSNLFLFRSFPLG